MAILRVRESFFCNRDGLPRVYSAGELVDSGDVVVKGREHLFEAVEATAERTTPPAVEQATAAPGEKRHVSTRRGK
jgi:hypothetical protein